MNPKSHKQLACNHSNQRWRLHRKQRCRLHRKQRCRLHRKQVHAGSVSLILVLVLAMVVGTFAVSLSGRAAQQRRAMQHHQSIVVLESAINAAEQADFSGDAKLRLPLDAAAQQWIVVERVSQANGEPHQYQATHYKNDEPGLSIRRVGRIHDELP